MELAIALFIGVWIAGFSFLAYKYLKKEYKNEKARREKN